MESETLSTPLHEQRFLKDKVGRQNDDKALVQPHNAHV
jgi:hypothetical protein